MFSYRSLAVVTLGAGCYVAVAKPSWLLTPIQAEYEKRRMPSRKEMLEFVARGDIEALTKPYKNGTYQFPESSGHDYGQTVSRFEVALEAIRSKQYEILKIAPKEADKWLLIPTCLEMEDLKALEIVVNNRWDEFDHNAYAWFCLGLHTNETILNHPEIAKRMKEHGPMLLRGVAQRGDEKEYEDFVIKHGLQADRDLGRRNTDWIKRDRKQLWVLHEESVKRKDWKEAKRLGKTIRALPRKL